MIRHFEKGDCDRIKLQPEQKHEDTNNWYLFDDEDTIVFEYDNRVLAIVRPFFEDGGRVWLSALISADCRDKGFSMFKQMRKIIDDFLNDGETQRVEMITQDNFPAAKRLAKMLGFTCEGTMKKYYNGLDFNIWGRVK